MNLIKKKMNTNDLIRIIGLIILIIGLFLIIYSFFIPTYTNELEYLRKYQEISNLENKTELFYKLRESYLTPKYRLEDYSITAIIISLCIIIVSFIRIENLKTPDSKLKIIILGLTAVFFTNFGYIGDLFLEMFRGNYPHWADSMGIPLMGVPYILLLTLFWLGINSLPIIKNFNPNVLITKSNILKLNYWFTPLIILTILLMVLVILTGYFWQLMTSILWLYFYLSIKLGISNTNNLIVSDNK